MDGGKQILIETQRNFLIFPCENSQTLVIFYFLTNLIKISVGIATKHFSGELQWENSDF